MSKSLKSLFLLITLAASLFAYPVQTVHAIAIPAEINKQFTPILIDSGGISVLRVTVFNPNTFELTNASWTDNLVGVQTGLSIAPPGLLNNTCGGDVTAVPGTTTLSLSGGNIPAQVQTTPGECYVEINVTSTTTGNLINTIPANNLNANGNDGGTPVTISNTTPASATLTVVAVLPPTLSKGFSPNTISMGDVSTLSITINNNDSDTNLTGTSFTDTLPAGVVLANPAVGPTPLTNCGGSASLTAVPGTNTITLTNATVTPSLNCVVAVNVTSATQGVYVNTIPAGPAGPGSIRTNQGVTNPNPASSTLNVQPVNVAKQFNPAAFQAGGTSTLTITIQNPTGATYTGVSLSDTLPTTPNTNLTYVAGSATTTCAPGTVSNTSTTVTLTGGSIPPNSSCTITVNVTTPSGATAATYTNVIPAGAITIASNPGATNVIEASADVSVYAAGTGMAGSVKSFFPATINAGQNSRLRIDLFAPPDTNLTNFSIIDNLPAGVTVSNSTAPSAVGCGATPPLVFAPQIGDTTISLSGGTILAGTRCRIQVWVTSSTPGTVTNTILPTNISNNENRHPAGNLTSNLTVNSLENLSVSKAFNPPTVNPGGLSVLTITLRNTYPSPLINTSLTDPLPGSVTNGVVVAPVPDASTTCAGGTITAVPGSQTITMTGGTVPAQVGAIPGTCTITVTVQGNDSNATPSNRTNTIPAANVTGTVQSTGVTINPINSAQATLRTEILFIGVVKGFDPVLVYGGAYSTMSVQLVNPNNITLTGIAFTDNMDLLGSGIVLADPVAFNVGTCGGLLTGDPGDASFSFSGGSLPPNSTCTLTLRVVMSVNGNRTNRIPAGAVTTFNGVSSTQPTEASLTNLPGASVSKTFNPNAIFTGEFSTLTITIQNTSNIPLVDMALTDNLPGILPGALEIAAPPAPAPVNNCNGTLTAEAGSQIIQLTNGSLAGNSSCTISVSVTSNVPDSYVNTIPVGGLTGNAGGSPVSNNNPASDTLVVNPSGQYSLGNRVWFDTDNSGTINGTETGINSVDVELYSVDALGNTTLIATQTTANGGYYRFDNLPAGDYRVVIPASEFGTGGTLDGYWNSGTTINEAGVVGESAAPDADNDIDNDDNGTLQTGGMFTGSVVSSVVTLGPLATEPTNDSDADPTNPAGEAPNDRSNRTVDFGFYRTELGNLVFVDANNNGTFDAGDTPLAGATVRLYSSNGTEINVGPDGILGTADDATGGMITGAGGTYLFSGLPAGSYTVGVTPPNGFTSTVDTAASGDTTNPDMNINNNDNGVGTGSGEVLSNVVTLTPGSLGVASNNNVNNTTGTTTNPTLDFGFNSPSLFSLGNRVWFDTDNSKTINGAEAGINGVVVELYRVDGSGNAFVTSQTTANGGYYRFDNLPAGVYRVVIPASEFGAGGTLDGYWSSGTTIDGAGGVIEEAVIIADSDIDNDDNGALQSSGTFLGAVVSSVVTLGPSANEPTNDSDADPTNPAGEAPNNQSNRTVDFGFYRMELGNLVFIDANNNGLFDTGDTPLAGATVRLYSSNGTEINVGPDGIFGTADDATGGVVTGAGGTYLFSGLPAGDYIVRVTPPAGYTSTVDVNADTNTPNNNVDNNDNGVGVAGGQVSSNIVSLIPGVAGTSTVVINGTGTTRNPSLDFGFVLANDLTKRISGSNQETTSGSDATIGEIITYQVSVVVPPGIYNNATLVDTMERGLAFVGCDAITAPGLTTNGNTDFTPICTNPTADDAGGGTLEDVVRRVTFDFGTLTNNGEADATLTVTYRAIVLDIAANVTGANLNNSAVWNSSAGSIGPAQAIANIIEPEMIIAKTANVNFVANGSTATFTLVISHTPTSATDAFDAAISDTLPAGLDYVPNSIDCDDGEQDPDPGTCVYDAATRTIRAQWSTFTRLPANDRGIIRFDVIGNSSIPANGIVTNVANVEWTSLPGDQRTPQSFSVPPNPPNQFATERFYDPTDEVNVYNSSASLTLTPLGGGGEDGGNDRDRRERRLDSSAGGFLIPVTGFAPHTVTKLNAEKRPVYGSTNLTLEIPVIKVKTSIVGVALNNGKWDVSWLQNQVGWLNGTAYPTWTGNSVLTGHTVNVVGQPSVFSRLKQLNAGEYIYVYDLGYRYTYKVVSNKLVQPNDITVLKHEDKAYLTLITCDDYNEKAGTYLRRIAVRAVLVDVREAK